MPRANLTRPLQLTLVLALSGCSLLAGVEDVELEPDGGAPSGSGASSSASTESGGASSTSGPGGVGGVGTGGSGGMAGAGGAASGGGGSGGTCQTTYRDEVLKDTPLGYWRLDETSGSVAADTSPNGKTGTYIGGVSLNVAGALACDPNAGAAFDGMNDWVSLGDEFDFPGTAAFSIEAWVKPGVLPDANNHRILSKSGPDGMGLVQGYTLTLSTTTLGFRRYHDDVTDVAYTDASQLPAGVYSHVVATFDGSMITLYVNGVALDADASPFAMVDHGGSFLIGAQLGADGDTFLGSIDEVAVYGSCLTATRVDAHYNAATSP